jgi:outer membrane protein OmpA-like peptidoglycan-associated protein
MRPVPHRLPTVIAALSIAALVAAGAAGAATIEEDIAQTRARLESALAADLQLVAPRHFEKAEKSLAEAEARLAGGGKIEDIGDKIDDANEQLARCESLGEVGMIALRDAIEARRAAQASSAPDSAPQTWAQAEASMRKAGEKVEDDKQQDARKEANRAALLYRDAELQAIEVDILGAARQLRAAAVEAKADELAAVTLAEADRLLAEAERQLESDRYERVTATSLAAQAAEEYRHATHIAQQAKAMDNEREQATEAMIRDYEAQLARIATLLDFEARFSAGVEPVIDEIVAAIESGDDDRANLRAELEAKQAEVRELEARLAPLEERDAQLRERERRDRTLREVEGLFTTAEAEVMTRGDQLIIRLYGLSFPSGSSEIRPEDFALLTKLLRALRQFPKSPVAIEGHTDSRGDERSNQKLSQERANAVREYVVVNLGIEPDWIMAVGFGESRPIAANDSEAGRAKNRRIDVVVDLIGG